MKQKENLNLETVTNKTVKIVSRNHKYANTFGGVICDGDFFTSGTVKNKSADRIISAWKFDNYCSLSERRRLTNRNGSDND